METVWTVSQHVEYKNAKKVKMDKNGYNINNFIDTGAVAEDFLKLSTPQ